MSRYSNKFKDPRWQRKRLEVLQRADWECQACGDKAQPLEVHHGCYQWGVEPWDAPNNTLWCLCGGCHQECQEYLSGIKRELGRINPGNYSIASELIRLTNSIASAMAPDDLCAFLELFENAALELSSVDRWVTAARVIAVMNSRVSSLTEPEKELAIKTANDIADTIARDVKKAMGNASDHD